MKQVPYRDLQSNITHQCGHEADFNNPSSAIVGAFSLTPWK
jgi:hypothetical protein